MMNAVGIIMILLILAVAFAVAFIVEFLLSKPLDFMENKFIPFISKPLLWIYRPTLGRIPGLAVDEDGEPDPWSDFQALVFFGVAAVAVGIFLLVETLSGGSFSESLGILVFGTTIGSLFGFVVEGIPHSAADLLCTGFAGLLSFICMQKTRDLRWWKQIIYNIIFILFCGMLGQLMANLFDVVAAWGVDMFNTLVNDPVFQTANSLETGLKAVGLGIVVLIFAYLAFVMIVIFLDELAAAFRFGALPFVMFFLFGWLMSFIGNELIISILAHALLFGMIFLTEVFRLYPQYDPMAYIADFIRRRI